MGRHALLSASSSHRWLNCPPSARLCEGYEDKGSEYAQEGTDAHSLCEHKLKMALGMETADPHGEPLLLQRGDGAVRLRVCCLCDGAGGGGKENLQGPGGAGGAAAGFLPLYGRGIWYRGLRDYRRRYAGDRGL